MSNSRIPIVALLISFIFPQTIAAQQASDLSTESNSFGTTELVANMDDVRSLISNLQLYMNFLGDESTGLRDKDVIINESYSKIFLSDAVQVEDDLDTNRAVVTYKPVQAYLKDIDFFFNNVAFEFRIETIEQSFRENGAPFYIVETTRLLEARDLNDSTISNQQQRFIEINLQESGELKIASIYTTQLNQKEERRLWWNSLSSAWRQQLAGASSLTTAFPFAEVTYFDEQILLTTADTFLLKMDTTIGVGSTPIRSTLQTAGEPIVESPVNNFENLAGANWSTLEIGAAEIDRQLELLVQQRSLTIDKGLEDLSPISRLTELRKLDLSNRGLTDLAPVRQLSKLRELNISGNPLEDLAPLRYLGGLEVLLADSTQVNSLADIRRLTRLKQLSLANTPLSSIEPLAQLPKLQQLNIAGAKIDSLAPLSSLVEIHELVLSGSNVVSLEGLAPLKQLRFLDASNTNISNVLPLRDAQQLERLLINNTAIEDLSSLKNLSALKIVYCDGSKVDKATADALMNQINGLLVVYASDYLKSWWTGMPASWKIIFKDIYNFKTEPDKEMLQRMTGLRKLNLTDYPQLNSLAPIVQLHKLEELTIDGTSIGNIEPIEEISSLKKFSAAGCEIQSLGALSGQAELRTLDISSTEITELSPLYNLQKLEWVLADSNGISDSIASAFHAYRNETLLIYRTAPLTKWWTGLNQAWQELLLSNLAAEEDADSELEQDKFTLEKIARTKRLSIPPASISGLEHLRMLKELEELYFADNRVYSLSPLRDLKQLRMIDCSKNPISEIGPLSVMYQLEFLNLSNTAIKSLDNLTGLSTLEELNCSGTPIKQLNALNGMSALESLDCSNTKVKSLRALESAANLAKLIAFNTSISKYKIEAFQATHPDCEVVFY